MTNPSFSIRFDAYQTEKSISVNLYKGGKRVEIVEKKLDSKTLELKVKIDDNEEVNKWIFHGEVKPDTVNVSEGAKKIEIIINKEEEVDWPSIFEEDGGREKNVKLYEGWENVKITPEDVDEFDYKKHGRRKGSDIMELFKQIYADATPEQRRAMNKSFEESGGTVLSTNWADVANRYVEPKPPE